ncbi:MAG TPA: hypothetical protein VKA46_30810 [Gemmataceae bacterium]|nr:hypothetical protein [Gemmataceae bacterium]
MRADTALEALEFLRRQPVRRLLRQAGGLPHALKPLLSGGP